jgi:hypothetical protein
LLTTAPAHADDVAPLDPKLETKLKSAGWRTPTLLFQSTDFTVVSANKRKVNHVVIVATDGKLTDAGIAKSTPTVIPGKSVLPTVVELRLGQTQARANEGYDATSEILLVRKNGSIACRFAGSSSSSTGTACGSGGWTSVAVGPAGDRSTHNQSKSITIASLRDDQPPTIDVEVEHSGTWSEPDGKGGCLTRSPVRSGPMVTRYQLFDKRSCKIIPLSK